MLASYRAYPDPSAIVQQPAAQLPGQAASPRSAAKSEAAGWSRDVLLLMIRSEAHARQGHEAEPAASASAHPAESTALPAPKKRDSGNAEKAATTKQSKKGPKK